MNEFIAIAITENSFNITDLCIIVELQHTQLGLKKGVLLHSKQSGKSWKVKSRVLLNHAIGEQKIFASETVDFIHMKFSTIEKKNKSIDGIITRESQNIFQYYLKPIAHSSKPDEKEVLSISNY